ncbi:hypothetical protein CA54_16840 [Symmachiella macrocystis]|uniref:Uncharacterized protein n=1 Tax=Symmachiella macrocystis TaxID=2527985 RepID=A0A5C6BLD5_9PLAN|nr:hypothetical protein [Symmachiella macrocystis]TWU12858.1 hypothetical protein CA54_16840 [Symmachiella macrocystis]
MARKKAEQVKADLLKGISRVGNAKFVAVLRDDVELIAPGSVKELEESGRGSGKKYLDVEVELWREVLQGKKALLAK